MPNHKLSKSKTTGRLMTDTPKKYRRKKKRADLKNLREMTISPHPIKKTLSKEDMYNERLNNKDHKENRYVESRFFSDRDANRLKEIRAVCRLFNEVVEKHTKSREYSVILRYGIPKIAADFHFQFKRFRSYARDHGLFPEIDSKLKEINAVQLYKSCVVKHETGQFGLRMDLFDHTQELNHIQFRLLILYKRYSSQPNKISDDLDDFAGVTGLSDQRAAKILGRSASAISRARKKLEELGFIREIYFNGRQRKIRINI